MLQVLLCLCSRCWPAGDFAEALRQFELALDTAGSESTETAKLQSNISATLLELHSYDQALEAANAAITLQPTWDKAYLRKFQALVALKDFSAAMQTVNSGLKMIPSSIILKKAKQTLQELPAAVLQPHKHMRQHEPNQLTQPVGAAISRLHKAGGHCSFCLVLALPETLYAIGEMCWQQSTAL